MAGSVILEVEPVDIFQFANAPITLKAYLRNNNTKELVTGERCHVKALLTFEENITSDLKCSEYHPNLFEVVSNSGINVNGEASIVVKILDVSSRQDNKRFVIFLEAYRLNSSLNIVTAITNPIITVNNKLVLTESYTAPYVWYKDEGTKDKSIRVVVKLINRNGDLVTDRNVPLIATLVYSSGLIVQPLSVLTIFHERESPSLKISDTGAEIIRFRVNEVSRNHRKQLFHLMVVADVSQDSTLQDISPVTSLAFEVKSKRTADARKESTSKSSQHAGATFSVDDESNSDLEGAVTISRKISSGTAMPVRRGSSQSSNGIPVEHVPERGEMTASSHLNISPLDGMTNAIRMPQQPIPSSSSNWPNNDTQSHSFDVPFKALFSLADWTNAAAQLLVVLQQRQSDADTHASMNHLVETFPVRAHSCLQYLQQFLSIQEQYFLQQDMLVVNMQQQRARFVQSVESLNPTRTQQAMNPLAGGSSETCAMMPSSSAPIQSATNNDIGSEDNVTIIIARRIALSMYTDEFGIPAYTTNTPNGVSLLGFYKDIFDSTRNDVVWVFRPLHSYEIFNDMDINIVLIEAILEYLDSPQVVQDDLFYDLHHFQEDLALMRQHAFLKVAEDDNRSEGRSILYLDTMIETRK